MLIFAVVAVSRIRRVVAATSFCSEGETAKRISVSPEIQEMKRSGCCIGNTRFQRIQGELLG